MEKFGKSRQKIYAKVLEKFLNNFWKSYTQFLEKLS